MVSISARPRAVHARFRKAEQNAAPGLRIRAAVRLVADSVGRRTGSDHAAGNGGWVDARACDALENGAHVRFADELGARAQQSQVIIERPLVHAQHTSFYVAPCVRKYVPV
jgi:hypothetical protein